MKYIYPIVKIVVAIILLQTLYFKFSAHPDSIYIFEQTGLGDVGRIGSGIAELIAAILLLIPRTSWIGGILILGVISGAIMAHLTKLGIVVNDDGGALFTMAVIVFLGSLYTIWKERKNIPLLKNYFN